MRAQTNAPRCIDLITISFRPSVASAHARPSVRPPDVDHLAAAAPYQFGCRGLSAPVSTKGGAAPWGARSRRGNRRGPRAPRAPVASRHQHSTPGAGPEGGERPTGKSGRPHAAGTAPLGGGLRPTQRGGAPTPDRDRVRGTATPAAPRPRHQPASFRTPRGRVGTLVPHKQQSGDAITTLERHHHSRTPSPLSNAITTLERHHHSRTPSPLSNAGTSLERQDQPSVVVFSTATALSPPARPPPPQ